jgi:tetratricopeptide (TPR) repeat protein
VAATLGAAGFAHQAWRDRQARIAAEQVYQQQLRAEKRQHALEKALAVAMTGDLDAAENSIGECELLGASAGQVHMLRGQVAFHRGNVMPGIEHLRMAVALEKESVAAWAMLALLYFDAGQYGECEEILERLDRLQPTSPEDYLFKGCAEAILDPVYGLRTIDQAISRRNSPIARAMRAQVWAYRALDTARPRDIAAALDDVHAAKGMLPDNPFVLFVSAFTQLVAASVFAETGDKMARETALIAAGKDARALEGRPMSVDPVMIRYVYYSQTDAEQKGFELLRDASQKIYSPVILDVLAWDPYRRGEPAKVLEVLDRRKEPELFGDIERAGALVELPGGPQRALEAYQNMLKRYTQGSGPLYCQTVLLLLQRKSEVVAASRDLLERHHRLPRLRNTFHKNWLAFNAGKLTAQDFEKAAGDSRLEKCVTHHAIGMMRLAEGDREAARAQFRKSAATRYFFNFELDWSRFMLERMEKDPNWPPWIKPRTDPGAHTKR